jgi:hypothetical protein
MCVCVNLAIVLGGPPCRYIHLVAMGLITYGTLYDLTKYGNIVELSLDDYNPFQE